MNKENAASGMGVKVGTMPFELKTQGYYGYFDDWITDTDTLKIANNRASAATPPSGATGSLTTLSSTSIQWLITAEGNVKNYVASNTDEDNIGIRPGTFGKMTFSVVPKEQETVSISFKISLEPYKTVYQTQVVDGETVYVYADGADTPNELAPVSVANNADYADANKYIASHIMFFKGRTGEVGNYKYSGLITPGETFALVYDEDTASYTSELTFSKSGDDLTEKEFTIYWVWPETLAEAVLPETMQNKGSHAITNGTEIISKLQNDPTAFLMGYNSANDTNGTSNANLSQAVIKNYYSKLSSEYNDADQEIGDNIGYILLTLEAF